MPLLLLQSSSRLFFFPLLCLFFLLFFSLGSFMSPLSPAPSYSASLSFAHSSPQPSSLWLCWGGGGGGCLRRSDCATCTIVGGLCACPGFTPWFLSLCSVPPVVAYGSSSSLPPLASLLAPPFPLLWICGSRVVLYSGGFSWVVLASGSSAFLPSLFLCLRSSASVVCPLRIL